MESVLAVREAYRLSDWAQIVQEQQASGLNKREFCQQNGITERQFYYWLKKVRQAVVETAQPQLVELRPQDSTAAETLKIEWGEAKLELPGAVDMDAVAVLLRSIQAIRND